MAADELRFVISAKDSATAVIKKIYGGIDQVISGLGSWEKMAALLQKNWKNALLGIAGVIAGVGAAGVMANAKMEDAIADVSALLTSSRQVDAQITKAAMKHAQDLGLAASEAARAYAIVGSSVDELQSDIPNLDKTVEAVLELSTAWRTSIEESAKATTGAMNQFELGAGGAREAVNALSAGVKLGSAELPDLILSLKDAGTVAKASGISLAETVATLEVFAKVNIRGAEAGTAFRNLVLRLNKDVDTNYRPSVVGLTKALDHLNATNIKGAALQAKVGDEVIAAAQAATRNVPLIRKWTKEIAESNSVSEVADRQLNTLAGDWKKLKSTSGNILIKVGAEISPAVRAASQLLTGILQMDRRQIKVALTDPTGKGVEEKRVEALLAARRAGKKLTIDEMRSTRELLSERVKDLERIGYQGMDYGKATRLKEINALLKEMGQLQRDILKGVHAAEKSKPPPPPPPLSQREKEYAELLSKISEATPKEKVIKARLQQNVSDIKNMYAKGLIEYNQYVLAIQDEQKKAFEVSRENYQKAFQLANKDRGADPYNIKTRAFDYDQSLVKFQAERKFNEELEKQKKARGEIRKGVVQERDEILGLLGIENKRAELMLRLQRLRDIGLEGGGIDLKTYKLAINRIELDSKAALTRTATLSEQFATGMAATLQTSLVGFLSGTEKGVNSLKDRVVQLVAELLVLRALNWAGQRLEGSGNNWISMFGSALIKGTGTQAPTTPVVINNTYNSNGHDLGTVQKMINEGNKATATAVQRTITRGIEQGQIRQRGKR